MSIWLCSKSFKIVRDLTTGQDLTTSTTSVYFAKIFCFKSGLLLTTWNSAGISFFIHVDFARLFMVAKWTTRKSYGYLLVNFKKICKMYRWYQWTLLKDRVQIFFLFWCSLSLWFSSPHFELFLCNGFVPLQKVFDKCFFKDILQVVWYFFFLISSISKSEERKFTRSLLIYSLLYFVFTCFDFSKASLLN